MPLEYPPLVLAHRVTNAQFNGKQEGLAAVGLVPPWLAGLGMAGSSLVVVLNALRAARPGQPEHQAPLDRPAQRSHPGIGASGR